MVDVVCSEMPNAGARIHANVSVRAGGSAVNAAAAAVACGASATVVGRIGSDPAGDLVLAELAEQGIDATLARDPDRPTGAAVAFAGPSVVATRGANAHFAVGDVPETIDADTLFVSGFALFQSGSSAAASTALERFAGNWVGIDVGTPELAVAARDSEILTGGRETVLFGTAEEARALTGAEPEQAARALASRFSVACVKLGEDGAIAVAGDNLERRRADRAPQSAFGAGDRFAAVLLIALAAGDPLGRALERACDAGARAAARPYDRQP
jgi:2-dehydro-3-deoxygluconokinase